MEDPLPKNIEGSKRVAHTVEHKVDWGYVAIGLAVIVLAVKFGPPILGSLEDDEERRR